jgi:uncharacterized protein YgiB involved in biofilm formation
MKRSRQVSLTLMAAAGTVTLTACGEPEAEGRFYPTVEACVAEAQVTEAQCREGFAAAQAAHARSAPRFASEADCEAEFGPGACYPGRDSGGGGGGSGFFLPFLAGYVVSNLVDSVTGRSVYNPVYRSARHGGSLYTPGGSRLQTVGGSTVRAPAADLRSTPPARTQVLSRGGFGSRSSGVSS